MGFTQKLQIHSKKLLVFLITSVIIILRQMRGVHTHEKASCLSDLRSNSLVNLVNF